MADFPAHDHGKPIRLGSGSVLLAAIGIAVVLFLVLGGKLGWIGTWRLFGVPSSLPHFRDLDYLRLAADSARSGIDVYTISDGTNATIKVGTGFRRSTFVYPPVWLLLRHFNLSVTAIPVLAAVIETAALGILVLLMRGRAAIWGAVAALALVSPSTLLAFERGNIDLIQFTLVGGAALLLSRWTGPRLGGAFAVIGGGIILKFHPMFCAALAARRSRSTLVFAGGLAVLAAIYLASIFDKVRLISAALIEDSVASYGRKVAFIAWDDLLRTMGIQASPLATTPLSLLVALAVILTVGAIAIKTGRRGTALVPAANAAGAAFLFGAGIYCGTFLSASNFSYRLLFLLLCLPQLADWIDAGLRARALLGLVLLCLWLGTYPIPLVMAQLLSWTLFAALGFVLVQNLFAKNAGPTAGPAGP